MPQSLGMWGEKNLHHPFVGTASQNVRSGTESQQQAHISKLGQWLSVCGITASPCLSEILGPWWLYCFSFFIWNAVSHITWPRGFRGLFPFIVLNKWNIVMNCSFPDMFIRDLQLILVTLILIPEKTSQVFQKFLCVFFASSGKTFSPGPQTTSPWKPLYLEVPKTSVSLLLVGIVSSHPIGIRHSIAIS